MATKVVDRRRDGMTYCTEDRSEHVTGAVSRLGTYKCSRTICLKIRNVRKAIRKKRNDHECDACGASISATMLSIPHTYNAQRERNLVAWESRGGTTGVDGEYPLGIFGTKCTSRLLVCGSLGKQRGAGSEELTAVSGSGARQRGESMDNGEREERR